jgi:hypothetical protein
MHQVRHGFRGSLVIAALLPLAALACKKAQPDETVAIPSAVPVAVVDTPAVVPTDPAATVKKPTVAVKPKTDGGAGAVGSAVAVALPVDPAGGAAALVPTAQPTAITTAAALVPTAIATGAPTPAATPVATPAATPAATVAAATPDAGKPRKPRPGLFAPGVGGAREAEEAQPQTGRRRTIQAPTRPGAQ